MEMKHTAPHFIALAFLTIGLPWFFLLADEDHRLLPSLFIVVGAVAVLALDFFGPPALPDPLAAEDPEPWKRPPAANAQEAQAYQAWIEQALAATAQAPQTMPLSSAMSPTPAPAVPMNQAMPPTPETAPASAPAPIPIAPSMPPAPEAPAPRQSAAEELNRPISIGPLTSSSEDAPVNQPFSVGPLASPAPALQQAPEPQQVSEPQQAPEPQQVSEPQQAPEPQQVSAPQQAPDIAQPQQASADAYDDDVLDMTRAAISPGSRFTAADAIDPATPWDVQAEIARTRPDLWLALSKNPSIYPDLKAWLDRHINT